MKIFQKKLKSSLSLNADRLLQLRHFKFVFHLRLSFRYNSLCVCVCVCVKATITHTHAMMERDAIQTEEMAKLFKN